MVGVALVSLLTLALPDARATREPAQQTAEAPGEQTDGSSLFRTYCASCHGRTAKGDGPIADTLRIRPADLTLLAKHNRGNFDGEKAFRLIDGREPVKGHGDSDMPVWGDAFKRSHEGYSEGAVKARIEALVAYLKTIQVK